jgi:hypothetical protein
MKNGNKIIWLASYPKSGNTWFRVFLSNLLSSSPAPVDINHLQQSPIASSRQLFDEGTGLSASDLSNDEIESLRPSVYRQLAAEASEPLFLKIHDAWHQTSNGEPLIPAEVTQAVIYFIRNPLDVAISFAHHSGTEVDKIIGHMADSGYAFCSRKDRLHSQLEQRLGNWSDHVRSWTRDSGLPVKVLRYEDMKKNTLSTFSAAIEFLGMKFSPEKIARALAFSDFSELKKQELEKGFREKPPKAASFFRQGETGSWKSSLSPEQVQSIITCHASVMREFGYLDEKTLPIS